MVRLPDGGIASVRWSHDRGVIQEIFVGRVYDKVSVPAPGDVVVDIGAHIGIYTLRAAKQVGEKGLVVAVEPSSENFRALCRNIRLNRLRNAVPVNMALGSSEGRARLFADPYLTASSSLRFHTSESSFEVRVMTLDSLLKRLGVRAVNYIKVDAEGSEMEILEGMTETLSRSPRLSVSIAAYHYSQESQEVKKFLERYAYRVTIDDNYVFAKIGQPVQRQTRG